MIEFGMENLEKKKKKDCESKKEEKEEELEEPDEESYKNMINLLFEEENKMMEEDEKENKSKNRGLYDFEGKNWGDERRKKDKEALKNLLSDDVSSICSSQLSYM